jgi:hypothetical protein
MMTEGDKSSGKTPLQFHLRSLLIAITAGCIAFALIGRFGADGFLKRVGAALAIAGLFMPLIEFFYWWKKNMDKDP